MSEHSYSHREYVMAQRKAFEHGADYLYIQKEIPIGNDGVDQAHTRTVAAAKKQYPLKITRPRVVQDPDTAFEWRVIDGQLQFHFHGDVWHPMLEPLDAKNRQNVYGTALKPTAERVAVWADLFANPTETVDE